MRIEIGWRIIILVLAVIVILLLFGYQFGAIKVGEFEMPLTPPSEAGIGPSSGFLPPEQLPMPTVEVKRISSALVAERIQGDTNSSGGTDFNDNRVLVGMNGDGTALTHFTDSRVNARDATWSPNGDMLAFASNVGGDSDIYLMSTNDLRWLPFVQYAGDDRGPTWSPDGRWIAFFSDRDGDTEIYRMSVDGREIKQLTNNDVQDRYPSWSPDGRSIAYESGQCPNTNCWINLMDWDGQNQRLLVQRRSFWPSWSPDSRYVGYSVYTEGSQANIYKMDVTTGSETRLTDFNSTGQSWSPDGRQIAFVGWVSGAPQIWVMNSDGTDAHTITSGAWHTRPVWSP